MALSCFRYFYEFDSNTPSTQNQIKSTRRSANLRMPSMGYWKMHFMHCATYHVGTKSNKFSSMSWSHEVIINPFHVPGLLRAVVLCVASHSQTFFIRTYHIYLKLRTSKIDIGTESLSLVKSPLSGDSRSEWDSMRWRIKFLRKRTIYCFKWNYYYYYL